MTADNVHASAARLYDSLPARAKALAHERVMLAEAERWESGQDSIDLIDERPIDPERNKPYSKTAIRICVGMMYDKDDETIRLREHVTRVVGDLRENYPKGVITFEYWRAMIGVKPAKGEDKREALARIAGEVIAHYNAYGRKPTPGMVRSWAHGNRVVEVWRLQTEGLVSKYDKIWEDAQTPVLLHGFIGYSRMVIKHYLETGVMLWGERPEED
jgi:hypothetical protein